MKKILFFIITFILINTISEAKSIYFPGYFYHQYNGLIGNKKATMELMKDDSSATGFFYFESDKKPRYITIDSSKILENAQIKLYIDGNTEYDSLSIPTTTYDGKFIGNFNNFKEFEGTYTASGAKPEAFKFKVDESDSYARIKMERMATSYTNAETNFTMKFLMNYPKFYHADNSEYKGINDSLRLLYLIAFDDSISYSFDNIGNYVNNWYQRNKPEFDLVAADTSAFDYTKEETEEFFMTPGDWSSDINFFIEMNEHNILSLAKTVEEDYGGLHPVASNYYFNFDLKTQKGIFLDDIFIPEKIIKIEELALEELIRMDSLDPNIPLTDQDFWFENDKFYLTPNYSIKPNGIMFIYNPYEISSYARGPVEIFLSYDKIKEFLQKNIVLYKYINK